MSTSWRVAFALSVLVAASPLPLQTRYPDVRSATDVQSVADELKWRVEQLRSRGTIRIGDEVIEPPGLALEVYERRGFQPLWTDRATVDSLLMAILGVWEDGLDPELYHLSTLAALAQAADGALDASRAAELDLLSTTALVRLSRDLEFGRVEPVGPASGPDSPWSSNAANAVANLAEVVASGRIREAVAALRPDHFVYEGLMRALADLRHIRVTGGWERIPEGPTLRPDSVDARVPALRRRLVREGYLVATAVEPSLRIDSALQAAVASFQRGHGLNEDGIVGKATLDQLNVPVERRIEQVRVNLERARWVARALPDTFVGVNVAGAEVRLFQADSVVFETRAIVGTHLNKTPVFAASMLYVDLNPTWTVPPGIVGEILDLVVRDSTYLERQGMRVLDGTGHEIDASTIDFSRHTAADFPYLFRQDPGPANALGEIKLIFPNEHRIYLHDTPTRGLFAKEERLFSHGCIRVQDPLGLAELVLGDPARWNRETLRAAIETGETRTIRLATPVPVFVLYWTAAVDAHGARHFYRDVYDRDAAVLAALDAPASGTRAR